jgi:hypothetical protein
MTVYADREQLDGAHSLRTSRKATAAQFRGTKKITSFRPTPTRPTTATIANPKQTFLLNAASLVMLRISGTLIKILAVLTAVLAL